MNQVKRGALDLLYPNPAQKIVNVSDPQSIVSITVYSSVGQMIYHTDEVQDVLDIRGWQNGLYFFDIEMQDRSKEIVKLVKNN